MKCEGNKMSDNFKLPGSSYDEIVKIIQAYASGKQGQSMSLDVLRQATGIDKTNVSRNNGFLMQLELITEGKEKAATETGYKLGRAYTHNIVDDVKQIWLEIIENEEFLGRMISAVKIRGGMDRTSFVSHILYSSGTNPNGNSKAGANTIIDILKLVEVITEVDGKLQINNSVKQREIENPTSKDSIISPSSNSISSREIISEHATLNSPQIKMNLNITLDLSNFDEMEEKILNLIDKLKN